MSFQFVYAIVKKLNEKLDNIMLLLPILFNPVNLGEGKCPACHGNRFKDEKVQHCLIYFFFHLCFDHFLVGYLLICLPMSAHFFLSIIAPKMLPY